MAGRTLKRAFDYYVRSIVSATIAVGIVGSALFLFLTERPVPDLLAGWGLAVISFYLGVNAGINGRRENQQNARNENL